MEGKFIRLMTGIITIVTIIPFWVNYKDIGLTLLLIGAGGLLITSYFKD